MVIFTVHDNLTSYPNNPDVFYSLFGWLHASKTPSYVFSSLGIYQLYIFS